MIILGIDPGTARMGCAILEAHNTLSKKPNLLASSVLTTSMDLDAHKRLHILYKGLNSLIKTHKPDVMVIERIFFNTNVTTAMSVGQARGVALLAAATQKMDVFEYTALQAKLVLTGYGRSDKKVMQKAVMDFLGLDNIVKSDDANDAVAMALCFLKKDLYAQT